MRLKGTTNFFVYIVLLITIISCVKDVDFNQGQNLSLDPEIAATLVYLEVEASQFSENGIEQQIVRDSISNIEIFEAQFIEDNLVKAEMVFETTNSINRSFNLQVEFLSTENELQQLISFNVLQSSSGNPILTEFIEVFEDESLEALKSITKMVITLTLDPSTDGSMLNENSIGEIALKSKGLFYFNINL